MIPRAHRLSWPCLFLALFASAPFVTRPAFALPSITTDALLDSLQYGAFRYFWDEANPANGLIRDRSQPYSPCSIAAQGFGLSAVCVGADHGWVTREAARDRVLVALQTFWNGPQGTAANGTIGYKGFFYHFLDMNTAMRTWTSELSTIDTALLLAGILDAKRYFRRSDPDEIQIRDLADSIYRRVDWTFMRNCNPNCTPGILHGWKPESGFINIQWIGYNEAMILYILALGSPTHAVPGSTWTAWTGGYDWITHYDYTYVEFAPLFGHQYSHCWVDFRFMQDAYMMDKGITYFENSRRATYAQQAYCIANPGGFTGYGAELWGLTASDDPFVGYQAHGAPPAQNDNGTLTPTAPISSIPFAPEICIPVAQNLYDNYKSQLWGPYGFKDAFNLGLNWWDTDALGIDQGPILLMIENYRTERVWGRTMSNMDVQLGLERAGFVGTVSVPSGGIAADGVPQLLPAAPNPFTRNTTLRYLLPRAGPARVTVYDLAGREIVRLVDGEQEAGLQQVTLQGAGLPSGVYRCRLETGGHVVQRAVVLLR